MRSMIYVLALSVGLLASTATAITFPPITNPTVKAECSECHMAHQPQMLPKRSWIYMLETLDNHFGGDASLDEDTAQAVLDYLTANAADVTASQPARMMLRGVAQTWTPRRISDLPTWRILHRFGVAQFLWYRNAVKSIANCNACHRYAKMGMYSPEPTAYPRVEFRARGMRITRPWSRATAGSAADGTVFMVLTNHARQPDTLVAASSSAASEIHFSVPSPDQEALPRRRTILVPAGTAVALHPDGLHGILKGLKAPLRRGSTFPLTLTFEHAGAIAVEVPVQGPGAMAPGNDRPALIGWESLMMGMRMCTIMRIGMMRRMLGGMPSAP